MSRFLFSIWWKFLAAYSIKFYLFLFILIYWTTYGLGLSFFNSTPHGCRVLGLKEHISTDTVQATAQQQGFLFYQYYPASRLGMCKRLEMKTAGTADLKRPEECFISYSVPFSNKNGGTWRLVLQVLLVEDCPGTGGKGVSSREGA